MKQTKVQHNVAVLVKRYPELKNNYNALVTMYWREVEKAQTFDDLATCTKAESITRAFRKLVEGGEIQVDGKVQQMRMDLEEEFRGFYAK